MLDERAAGMGLVSCQVPFANDIRLVALRSGYGAAAAGARPSDSCVRMIAMNISP